MRVPATGRRVGTILLNVSGPPARAYRIIIIVYLLFNYVPMVQASREAVKGSADRPVRVATTFKMCQGLQALLPR